MLKVIDLLLTITLISFSILFVSRIIFSNNVFLIIQKIIVCILFVLVALPLILLLLLYIIGLIILLFNMYKPHD